jgi:uncharacterized protein (DUF1684 family)
MRITLPPALLAALAVAGCSEAWPDPAPIDTETLLAEHEEWRSWREERLVTPPGGAVLWMGLWDLPEGDSRFGSADDLAIELPEEDAPALAGVLRREGATVTLEPAPGVAFRIRTSQNDEADVVEVPVTAPIVLENDRSDEPTTLVLGSLGLRVHSEPGTDRLWLRAWDEDSPARETFRLPAYFPVSDDWRVAARFVPYDEPEIVTVPDVRGGSVEYRVPGELAFRHGGRDHTLQATAGETSTSFFVMMWDSTATVNTYQAGRYLRVELPDENGWTEIDFNRAYNAPCVFTPHSVCAIPPRDNWLTMHVTAGEQRPDEPPS